MRSLVFRAFLHDELTILIRPTAEDPNWSHFLIVEPLTDSEDPLADFVISNYVNNYLMKNISPTAPTAGVISCF